jgi:DNA-binding response OmpR family regulator
MMVEQSRGRKVRLTDKETGIIRRLLRAGRAGMNRQALLNDVWGYSSGVTTHTLETHVYRLRQKIEQNPAAPSLLLTIGNGYALSVEAQAAGQLLAGLAV